MAAVGGSLGRRWDDSGSDLLQCCAAVAAVVAGRGSSCIVVADGSVSYCPSVDSGKTPDRPPSG